MSKNYLMYGRFPRLLPTPEGKQPFIKILMLLRSKTGHDFLPL
jgi:hypothetical protein